LDFWLNLQEQHALRVAEQKRGWKIRETVSLRGAQSPSPALHLPESILLSQE
jgi:hypothetical protein